MHLANASVPAVLSSAKIGRSSWRYYQEVVSRDACAYYTGEREAPGHWHGRGLPDLGLTARAIVTEAELEALFARGISPRTGAQLGRPWRTDGVTGFDLCFSAPKSVSALWALGNEELAAAVTGAHRAAVRAALGYLDTHAAFSRVGTDGHTQVPTAGFAAALFDHRTSRAGDPQLHTHALVLNKVRCPDGAWRTVDGAELFHHKRSAGALYQAALRSELTRRLGIGWDAPNAHGQAEIAGMPPELLRVWSKRTAQVLAEATPVIESYQAALGRELSPAERIAVVKTAVLKTRPAKTHVPASLAHARWQAEAAGLGLDPAEVFAQVRAEARTQQQGRAEPGALRTDLAVSDPLLSAAVAAVGFRQASFSRAELVTELAGRSAVFPATAAQTVAAIEADTDAALAPAGAGEDGTIQAGAVRLRDADPVGCPRRSDSRYAAADLLAAETRITARADAGRGTGRGLVAPEILNERIYAAGLDPGQGAAIYALGTGGDFCSVLVAPAGTGKTTALGAAARAFSDAGYQVVGLAPSARAAAELAAATGAPADTVARWCYHQPRMPFMAEVDHRYLTTDHTVLVVDEASMLATVDLDALTAVAWAAGAKVVLVGDPAQIGPVRCAGGMLGALANRLGAPSLSAVHRFDEAWERTASLALRTGNPIALRPYAAAGRLHPAADGATAAGELFAHWQAETRAGASALMMARSRADVAALNDRAREAAISAGEVHGPVLVAGETHWRAGDLLRATRNDRRLVLGSGHVRNGDRFTVLGPGSENGLLVEQLGTGERALLPERYVRAHTGYGWAGTVDAAQGATVDVGLLLVRPGLDREHLYVGMTRGRRANHVYLFPDPAGELDAAGHPGLRPVPAARQLALPWFEEATRWVLTDALARPGRQEAAYTRLVETSPPEVGPPDRASRPPVPTLDTPWWQRPPRPPAEPEYLQRAREVLAGHQRHQQQLVAELGAAQDVLAAFRRQRAEIRPWQRRRGDELDAWLERADRQLSATTGALEHCGRDLEQAVGVVSRYEGFARVDAERQRAQYRWVAGLGQDVRRRPVARRPLGRDGLELSLSPSLDRDRGRDLGR